MEKIDLSDLPSQISNKYCVLALSDAVSLLTNEIVESESQATAVLVHSLIKTAAIISKNNSELESEDLKKLLQGVLDSCFDETNLTIKLLNMECTGRA